MPAGLRKDRGHSLFAVRETARTATQISCPADQFVWRAGFGYRWNARTTTPSAAASCRPMSRTSASPAAPATESEYGGPGLMVGVRYLFPVCSR